MLRCSDCGTKLVLSEEDAIAGRQAATRDPYRVHHRALGAVPVEGEAAPRRPVGDTAVGLAWIAGGMVLMLLTYAFAPRGGGREGSFVLVGPVLYGLFRLIRPARG